jgi:two-component system aerobic respiration control sensor histidine kinase ArcB
MADRTDQSNITNPAQGLDLFNHDIRSAVSEILGGLRLIDGAGLAEADQRQLERVRGSAELLAYLMDDMLAAAQGQVSHSPQYATLNLSRYLKRLALRWSAHAFEKGLKFRLNRAQGLPDRIHVNKVSLDRILTNALSNAMKFTQQGWVTLRVSLDGENLVFCVLDDGPGLSDAALDQLFTRGAHAPDSGQEGSGLGLFISHDLAAGIGGALSAGNRAQGGAQITLCLPLAQLAPAPMADGDLSDLRILVAEDNNTLRLLLADMLDSLGAEFTLAENGVQAMDWVKRESFDMALLDIEMPKMTGLEVIRAVRRMAAPVGNMPIVAMTAFVMNQNRDAIFAAGATGLMAKPLPEVEDFAAHLRRALARQDQPELAAALDLQQLNWDHFHGILRRTDFATQQELLSTMRADLTAVRDALRQPGITSDTNQLRGQIHILMALSGAMGAERLHALARSLGGATPDHCAPTLAKIVSALDDIIPILIQEQMTLRDRQK